MKPEVATSNSAHAMRGLSLDVLQSSLPKMSRPLRVEFAGATYHVTARGDRREPIYCDDEDRRVQLAVIAHAMDRFDALVMAYCQMGNHFHLVLHTRQANLSRLMRHVNGVYTQSFNRRYGLVGHLFQGRFKAILVDTDAYLLALCRYVERNPVAARLVARPEDWAWSSCRAHVGLADAPEWLDSEILYGHLLGQAAASDHLRKRAVRLYAELVSGAKSGDVSFWSDAIRAQVFLGDDEFMRRTLLYAVPERLSDKQLPRQQRTSPLTWAACVEACFGELRQALHMAHREAGLTMTELARRSGYSVSHVSRMIASAQGGKNAKRET